MFYNMFEMGMVNELVVGVRWFKAKKRGNVRSFFSGFILSMLAALESRGHCDWG